MICVMTILAALQEMEVLNCRARDDWDLSVYLSVDASGICRGLADCAIAPR